MSATSTDRPSPAAAAGTAPAPAEPTSLRWRRLVSSALELTEVRWASVATGLFALGAVAQVVGAPAPVWWTLYLACYATGGWEPALEGLRALRARVLDVDLLMIVAAVLAASIGQVFDGALLVVIFATSGALEAFATKRTEDSVQALLTLAPERATRMVPGGAEEEVDAATLVVGDVVLVRPGERIGADGRVVDGLSAVDQSSVTGEPLPVAKAEGDQVFAGTLNGAGALTVAVDRAASDTVVARIVAMVEEASATKATTQLFIEKIEQRYSVGVVVATLGLFTVPLLLGAAFEPTLLRAMTFMIVASPCAIVLATMPPLLATIANAGRHGVLVKSAVALERIGAVTDIAFDKTGTLTHGAPRVARVHVVGELDEPGLLHLAATAERRSEHPVARALVTAARRQGVAPDEPRDFSSVPGRGVTAYVGGRRVDVGSPALLERTGGAAGGGGAAEEVREVVRTWEDQGHTVVVVLVDEVPAGAVALADQVREGAAEAVASLVRLTGASPVLLTGDNRHAARRLADEVGIDRVESGLLPDEKVAAVRALRATPESRVMLVGDGVNDAPAMAAADVGVAMGRNGSDLAVETADVILVRDDLAALAPTVALARRAHRVVRANLVIAAVVIAVLVVWDLVATLPLPLGVAGHEGSTIVVALNGLRLLRRGAWT
ncbi:heavy metal translocating P-type ATPase [Nocardioides alkalitolerans]|uniref:heavy metal translocating P-type ATPase n=1 Tax=Nocardioides alkalitolerans TaxID=281714 RepID=UPI0004242367|nr:heavy metal translocating P-type ATPase [Nocardioides alkalitolerans]